MTCIMDAGEQATLLEKVTDLSFNVPHHDTKIYKDECLYCFHTPFFPNGLFVCMKTFAAVCANHLPIYAAKNDSTVFVQIVSRKELKAGEEPAEKVSRLAIGVDDGFCSDKHELVDEYFVVVMPEWEKRLPIAAGLGPNLYVAAQRVVNATSAERLALLQSASNAWDGEIKQVTKHANLEQHNNGKQIAVSGWACEEEGCGLTENLWLNLTDGAIRCGRSQFIAEGQKSKGNNHMKQYYDATGFPLVVKLGTIEKDGTGDVYSYSEDDAVIDPNLSRHLLHFGLDARKLEKTEKSTLELELDINQKWEWARLQEEGANLENVYGAKNTGLINIGSSCYMNSVVQTLLQVPDWEAHWKGVRVEEAAGGAEAINADFRLQTAKLVAAMCGGQYAKEDSELNGVKPTVFKRLAANGHHEFATAKQQDVEEYLRFLADRVSSTLPAGSHDPIDAFRFKVETRMEDVASGHVRYTNREEVVLGLPVPQCVLRDVEGQEGRKAIALRQCIEAAFAPEHIDGFKSPVTGEAKGATNTLRINTFPDFLFIQIQKFTLAADYSVKKLDLDVEGVEEIDLGQLRGTGAKEGETLLAEDVPTAAALPPVNETIVNQLMDMGFTKNAAEKATRATQSAEAAAEWLFARMDDPHLNEPELAAAPAAPAANQEAIEQLVCFGFTQHQAKFALSKHADANAAAEWLFGHAHEVPEEQADQPPAHKNNKHFRDGSGSYRLVGFISHMGSSPHSGHYVCHLLRDGRWVLFNDEKVAISQNPPKSLGYVYLYQRV